MAVHSKGATVTDTPSRRFARPSPPTLQRSISAALLVCAASPALAAAPYSRVLVVGVSPDDNYRCQFEQFLADQMQSDSTTVIQSCDVVTPLKPLTQAGIEQAVAAQQADAVVSTILVSVQDKVVEGGDRDTRGGDYFKAEGAGFAPDFWGLYAVPVIYGQYVDLPPVYTMQGTVEVETRVYDTASKTLVRSVKSKAKHVESTDEGTAAITEEVAKQLRREGVVR
jgi:hypothetical protein